MRLDYAQSTAHLFVLCEWRWLMSHELLCVHRLAADPLTMAYINLRIMFAELPNQEADERKVCPEL